MRTDLDNFSENIPLNQKWGFLCIMHFFNFYELKKTTANRMDFMISVNRLMRTNTFFLALSLLLVNTEIIVIQICEMQGNLIFQMSPKLGY